MKGSDFKEKLIAVTLDYIQKEESYINVNLREIARRAGCAHSNVYNYFSGLNEIIWVCFDRILEELVSFTQRSTGNQEVLDESFFKKWILAQIDFALLHTGYYRLIWIDPLFNDFPKENQLKLISMRETFEELIFRLGGGRFSRESTADAANILHGYLHGEICKLVSGRIMYENIQLSKETIIRNIIRIFEDLTQRR